MITSTLSSNVGLYMSSLFCKSFEMAGMADSSLLPPVFGKRNHTFGSPHLSILVTTLFTVALSGVNMTMLLSVTNVFAALVTMTIFASAIQLRYSLPSMPRPAKILGGLATLVAMAVIPAVFCAYLVLKNVLVGFKEGVMIATFLAPGLVYGSLQSRRLRSASFPPSSSLAAREQLRS